MKPEQSGYDKIVYLLQGGGALGAYQVGVCQRLLDEDWQPDWVIGTSIGAINAAIIAGNEKSARADKLQIFWDLISSTSMKELFTSEDVSLRKFQNVLSSAQAIGMGQPGFFKPRKINPWFETETTPDKISFYDTSELRTTLESLVDFDRLNHGDVRVTLSALCLNSGFLEEFDNQDVEITPEHVMASGALPPGFPAIKIGDRYYWDAGISSNTPLMTLLGHDSSDKMLCFMVDLFSNREAHPTNLMEVFKRKKDLEFSSRYHRTLHYFCRFHELHRVISKLCEKDPSLRSDPIIQAADIKEPCSITMVRYHYKDKPYELWSKDFDFSSKSIQERREAGYRDVEASMDDNAWFTCGHSEKYSGIILHEFPINYDEI